ncbi:MAG: acetylornithine/succinylornithine family transaminase [Gemmatimonadetes bacterium]|nr:acetylornithine/succinylornithine family transaminase [Gemmatimonadota bacterium]
MSATVRPAAEALLPVYRRFPVCIVAGEGCELIADDGTRYLDFVAGISVNLLGYNHPVLRRALERAAETGVLHTSNLYRTIPGEELAAELVERSFASHVFFCNSGAEANEGAFKFARRAAVGPEQREIVALKGSFHGRTFAALAATDRPPYREPFLPLVPGIRIVDPGHQAELERAITRRRTAAVIVEPVQGEGGVNVMPDALLQDLREMCTEAGAALIFDEIQCGLGRTGTLFAYQQTGVVPDLVTLAKGLGGGLPMGAVLVNETIAASVQPGDHATTFGGGPFVASLALAQLGVLSEPGFLAAVRQKGEWLGTRLAALAARHDSVAAVRGRGLMWGIELEDAAQPVVERALERGLLVISAGPTVIRLLPPLTITREELARGVELLESCL